MEVMEVRSWLRRFYSLNLLLSVGWIGWREGSEGRGGEHPTMKAS